MWLYNNELYHYGVLGMKWKQHKTKKAVDKYSKKAQRQVDANVNSAKHVKKILDSNYDQITEQRLTKDDRKQYMYEYRRSIDNAKKWMAAKKDIMNIKISDISAKDVKNRFKNYSNKLDYMPFA